MAKGFITDGMTVEEIINMPYEVKNTLNTREMRHALARVNNMANKRLDRLQKAVKTDGSLDKSSARVERFKTPNNLNEMRKEMKRVSSFINAKTSTITGAREMMVEKQARVMNRTYKQQKKALDKELNEEQKKARKKALKKKRKNDKKHKDKRKVKLTEKQKQKINEKVANKFWKKLRKDTEDVYELFDKFKEIHKTDAYVKGSPVVLQITKEVEEIEHRDYELTTMEKIDIIKWKLKGAYERAIEEENRKEEEARNKFNHVSALYD